MNNFGNIKNSGGLLKNAYVKPGVQKGPISQMNDAMPMMAVLRKKRDELKTK